MDTTIINSQVNAITFDQDNFTQRRASQNGAGVAYDPDSLLTGAEVERGLTYENSTRFFDPAVEAAAIRGKLPTETVLALGTRFQTIPTSDESTPEELARLYGGRNYRADAFRDIESDGSGEETSGRYNWYGDGE